MGRNRFALRQFSIDEEMSKAVGLKANSTL